ncbi:3'-5' exoribonuclease 1 isoform X2 [Rhinatrema bivittatum]|uniref:3'-5' exoribonuclease 1 isoform X2 n=1 Tax=Rhinatrema bivittatum TaxID=194408 RepID=UPI001127A79D|nr:3'-5' exoribonuclease 1 isoform X2 [Rhinatrema bivittatum]
MTNLTFAEAPTLLIESGEMGDEKENRSCVPEGDLRGQELPLVTAEKDRHRCRFDGQEEKRTNSITVGDYSDPVYKELAAANGRVNRMSREELRKKLAEFKLDNRGVKDVLQKRLKNHYKQQKLRSEVAGDSADTYYDYICIIDFEATCEEENPSGYVHEIIEFPIVLLNTRTLQIDLVDKADTFPQVLQNVVYWMREKELGTKYKYCILTDGSWDMSKFLNIQCLISHIKYPRFAKKWINIRKSYGNFYKVPRTQTKLAIMLENLGMDYNGRPHSGLDDSCNIARIAIRMLQDGCKLRVNERMHAGQLMTVASTVPIEGAPVPQNPTVKN